MHSQPVLCPYSHVPRLPSPQPIESDLMMLGTTPDAAQKMSLLYLQKAEALRKATETIIDLELTSIPHITDRMELESLLQCLFAAHKRNYEGTLRQWFSKAADVARSFSYKVSTHVDAPSTSHGRKRLSPFKAEYLPLFEFAFSKDRFPSREDKKHLARISGMSYRQVSVWFQNRRCRSGKVTLKNTRPVIVGQPRKRFHYKGPAEMTHEEPNSSAVSKCAPGVPPEIELTGGENKQISQCLPSAEESISETSDNHRNQFIDDQNALPMSSIIDMGCRFPAPYNPTTASTDPFAVKAHSSLWNRSRGQKRPRFSERVVELREVTQDMRNFTVGFFRPLNNTEGKNVKPLPKRSASDYLATRSSFTFSSPRTASSTDTFPDTSESSISTPSHVLNIESAGLIGSPESYTRLWAYDKHDGDEPSPSLSYSCDNSSSDSLSSSHESLELDFHLHDSGEKSDVAPCHNDTLGAAGLGPWTQTYIRLQKTGFRGWNGLPAVIPSS